MRKAWRSLALPIVGFAVSAGALHASGASGCESIDYRQWLGGYWSCLYPPLCAHDYLEFPETASKYRRPISQLQLWRQLYDMGIGAVPVLQQAPVQGLPQALLDALNINFLVDGLNVRRLRVTLISDMVIKDGPTLYRQRELLFEDPYVGIFKGILLMPPGPGPFPAVLALHGHSETAEIYRDTYSAPEYPKQGIAILMITLRVMEPWIMEHYVTEKLLLNGFNLIGLRVYEALLALKYLGCQPDVKAGGLGLIGHSGGSSTANLVVRIAPERLRAYVSDYKINYYMLPSLEPYHCETVPRVYPYHALINDFSTLAVPVREVPYGYTGMMEAIIEFFGQRLN